MRAAGPSSSVVQRGRQDGDVAGDLAEAEILHDHRAQPCAAPASGPRGTSARRHRSRGAARNGRARRRRMLDQHLQDGRHGEHVGDAMRLDQPPGLGRRRSARRAAAPCWRAARHLGRAEWMPAPCDSGATTSEASASVVPGIRSQRWLVTTKAIWPCVSTAALGRPVVPEVKKNQQGSSYSTAAAGQGAPAPRRSAPASSSVPKRGLAEAGQEDPGQRRRHRRGMVGEDRLAEEGARRRRPGAS